MIFLDFAEFYRRFVKEFSQIVTSLTNLTRDAKKKSFFICYDAENQNCV